MPRNSGGNADVWKWISGLLLSVAVTNFGTALAMRGPTLDDIDIRAKRVVKEGFTEISRTNGLYVIEGRPRIDNLESGHREILAKINDHGLKLDRVLQIVAPKNQTSND